MYVRDASRAPEVKHLVPAVAVRVDWAAGRTDAETGGMKEEAIGRVEDQASGMTVKVAGEVKEIASGRAAVTAGRAREQGNYG